MGRQKTVCCYTRLLLWVVTTHASRIYSIFFLFSIPWIETIERILLHYVNIKRWQKYSWEMIYMCILYGFVVFFILFFVFACVRFVCLYRRMAFCNNAIIPHTIIQIWNGIDIYISLRGASKYNSFIRARIAAVDDPFVVHLGIKCTEEKNVPSAPKYTSHISFIEAYIRYAGVYIYAPFQIP